MGVEYSTEGQSGCSRGDSSQCRWEAVWGARIGRAPGRKTEPSQEHLGLLHQPFWRILVNDRM